MRRAALVALLLAATASAAAGCKGGGGNPAYPLQMPNAVSGGTRGGGRPTGPTAERQQASDADAKAKADQKAADEATAKLDKAEALWSRAQAMEDSRPSSAADDYQKIADDYKESPHAEEARYREALLRHRVGEWHGAERAVEEYLKDNPVNAHLAEIERILYESSVAIFDATRGIRGVFKSNKRGFDGLNLLVERFPEGAYADDALLALGDEYVRKEDFQTAATEYRSLLLRYPNSEWSFQARLKLADAYVQRDQGANYHPGYVDLDPRGPTSPQYAMNRPIRSCVEAALEEYQAFLDRIAADPARRAEYASEVEHAQEGVANCRARLAAKDRTAGAYYASHGEGEAASIYERYAENVEAGRPWSDGAPPPPETRRVVPATEPPQPERVRQALPPAPPPPPPPLPPPPQPSIAPEQTPPSNPVINPRPIPPPFNPTSATDGLPPPRHIPGTSK